MNWIWRLSQHSTYSIICLFVISQKSRLTRWKIVGIYSLIFPFPLLISPQMLNSKSHFLYTLYEVYVPPHIIWWVSTLVPSNHNSIFRAFSLVGKRLASRIWRVTTLVPSNHNGVVRAFPLVEKCLESRIFVSLMNWSNICWPLLTAKPYKN